MAARCLLSHCSFLASCGFLRCRTPKPNTLKLPKGRSSLWRRCASRGRRAASPAAEQEPPIGQLLCTVWARGLVEAALLPVEVEGAMHIVSPCRSAALVAWYRLRICIRCPSRTRPLRRAPGATSPRANCRCLSNTQCLVQRVPKTNCCFNVNCTCKAQNYANLCARARIRPGRAADQDLAEKSHLGSFPY